MKKYVSVIICLVLFASCLAGLTACGKNDAQAATGFSEVGIWENTDVTNSVVDGANISMPSHETIVLYSDNTFALVSVMEIYYSTDGGETYNPLYDWFAKVYGKYETVGTNEELGERTVKITEITRILHRDTNSDSDSALAEMVKNNGAIGKEIILGADYKMSEKVGLDNFFDMSVYAG